MASMSNWLENELIDHIFRSRAFTAPTLPSTLSVALFTTQPAESGVDFTTEVATAGNTSYYRVPVIANYSYWKGTNGETTNVDSGGTAGLTDNLQSIVFNSPAANWTTVAYFGLCNTVTPGQGAILIWGSLTASKTINAGDPAPYFGVGDLDFTIDN